MGRIYVAGASGWGHSHGSVRWGIGTLPAGQAQNEVDRLHPGRNSLIPRNQGLGSCGLGSRSMDRFSGGGDRASSIIVPG